MEHEGTAQVRHFQPRGHHYTDDASNAALCSAANASSVTFTSDVGG